jgi:hypothetical protein
VSALSRKENQPNPQIPEIDDVLDKSELSFVKISEEGSEEQFGILELPALVFIQGPML